MGADTKPLQVSACPECQLPAEITDRHVLESTDGPVEHARTVCVGGHAFNLPVAMLTGPERSRRSERARRALRAVPRSP